LQRLDAREPGQRVVAPPFEIVDQRELAFELTQRRVVVDLVVGEHRFNVAAYGSGERSELRRIANDVLGLAIDTVGEARKVGGLRDARLGVGEARGQAEDQREERNEETGRHLRNLLTKRLRGGWRANGKRIVSGRPILRSARLSVTQKHRSATRKRCSATSGADPPLRA